MLLNTFDSITTENVLKRLENLSIDTNPKWGKMDVAQMLAHLNVAYDYSNGKLEANNSWLAKIMLKAFVKKIVVGEKPYAKNSRTAPDFLITTSKEFEIEKLKLFTNIKETEQKGAIHFGGKESASFGPLTAKEWSIMFYKHIDHHLTQFGV